MRKHGVMAVMLIVMVLFGHQNLSAQELGPVEKVDKYNFSFQPPKDWKSNITYLTWMSNVQVDGITPNMNIIATPVLPVVGGFEANVDLIVKDVNESGPGNGLYILDTAKVEINGRKARFLYGQIPSNGIMFRTLQVIFDGPKEYVMFTYIINEVKWTQYKPLYEASAKTVKFRGDPRK